MKRMRQPKIDPITRARREDEHFIANVLVFVLINLAIFWAITVGGSHELWDMLKHEMVKSALHTDHASHFDLE